jgi:hypothetical protein
LSSNSARWKRALQTAKGTFSLKRNTKISHYRGNVQFDF